MQSTHVRGLVFSLICGLLCGCGATERNPDSSSGGAGGQGLPRNSDAATGGASTGGKPGSEPSQALSAADAMALFAQAPHCAADTFFQLDGSIDGVPVHDDGESFTGGFTNGSNGNFSSPSDGFPAEPERVTVSFDWHHSLSYGQASIIASGTLIAPLGHPRAGEELCITRGVVGFPSGGPEDGHFKFWLRQARLGPACGGAEVPIEIRGCMQ
jgi:hypothetical protein